MKKIIFSVIVLIAAFNVNAQNSSSNIVSSTIKSITTVTMPEPEPEPVIAMNQWFLRTGLNIMNFAGDGGDDLKGKVGYDVTLGFHKSIARKGAYWGMEFGASSRGAGYEEKVYDYEESLISHNVHISPFTFGWKYGITEDFKIDAHLGAFAAYDYAGKMKIEYNGYEESYKMKDWDDWNRYDVGLNAGFGVWYGRFNLDFTFRRGFIETFDDSESYTNNFMIRLGVAF